MRDTAPPFRGDSGIRLCITQGETQDAHSMILIGAVAAFLYKTGSFWPRGWQRLTNTGWTNTRVLTMSLSFLSVTRTSPWQWMDTSVPFRGPR